MVVVGPTKGYRRKSTYLMRPARIELAEMRCPDENTLVAYASGKLDAQAATVIENHMDSCEICPHLLPALFEAAGQTTHAGEDTDKGPNRSFAEEVTPNHGEQLDEANAETFVNAPLANLNRQDDLPSFEAGVMVDQFRIMRFLAKGGMGEVYLARDTQLARNVALKVIHPRLVTSQKVRDRFLLEARALARFSHPHIVTIYAVGLIHDIPYMALEFLRGQSLKDRLAGGAISEAEALRITLAICEALQEAHRAGILHRDLKSSNVLIPADGRVRVVDFGLAKVITPSGSDETLPLNPAYSIVPGVMASASANLTNPEKSIQGTPSYMSPEQWTSRMPSPATDIWAVGIMLHEMLTGHRPYLERGLYDLRDRVSDNSNVPISPMLATDLAPLIGGCLEKKAARRTELAILVDGLRSALARRRRGADFHAEPFRGLRAYPERYARFFYGREDEITAFIERMREEPILPIIGPSGAGKSSFVRAGVIPRLREQGKWHVIDFRPGERPFHGLASRLQRLTAELRDEVPTTATELPNVVDDLANTLATSATSLYLRMQHLADKYRCRFVIYVDQLEELATLVPDANIRNTFMEALCNVAQDFQDPVRVILTVRDDFLAPLVTSPRVRQALSRVTMMQSPGRAGLTEIISKPVEAVGYGFDDPTLIEEMVDSVENESASLALLQFASHSLWLRRDEQRKLLCRFAYEEMGGVAGALAYHADGVLADLSAEEIATVRELLLRLVTPQGTRRVLSRTRLLGGLAEDSDGVLKRLVNARLISVTRSETDNDAVAELAHESLISNWHRLARWLDDSREDLAYLHEIEQAAEIWRKRGRRAEELWSGDALADADRIATRAKARVPSVVVEFLTAANHRALRRTRRRTVAISFIVVVLAAIATALALQNRQISREQQEAEVQRAETQLEGAKRALVNENLLEARAKFRAAIETRDSTSARMLWHKLRTHPQIWRRELGAIAYDLAIAPRKAGQFLAVAASNNSVYLLHPTTGKVRRILRGHSSRVFAVDVADDGQKLASAGFNGQVRIWDTQTGKTTRKFATEGLPVWGLKFGPQSRWLAASSVDKTIWLWNVETGKLRHRLRGHTAEVWRLTLSADGSKLLSGSADGTVRIWDVETGKTLRILRGHKGGVWHLDASPDGKWLASVGADKTLRLWPLDPEGDPTIIEAHSAGIETVRFSPDSSLVATGSVDKEVRVWNVKTKALLHRLNGHSERIYALRFDSTGRQLFSAGFDRSVRKWAFQSKKGRSPSGGHKGEVWSAGLSPDKRLVASSGADKTIRIWRVDTGEQIKLLGGHQAVAQDVQFSPDGQHLISGSYDNTLRIWELKTGTTERVLYGHQRGVNGVSVSPDGSTIASASWDGTVRIWNAKTGNEIRQLSADDDRFMTARFSPDGKTVFAGGIKGPIYRWRLSDGKQLPPLVGHKERVWGLRASGDGLSLVSGSWDKTLRLWNLRTGDNRILLTHSSHINDIDLNPNQRTIAVPTAESSWRTITMDGKVERVFFGHQQEINRIRFDGSRDLAVSASDDGTVRIWNVNNGRPLWRAPALLHTSGELYTHQGWQSLIPRTQGKNSLKTNAAWREAIEKHARFSLQSPKGQNLCLLTTDGYLELWQASGNKPSARRQIADIVQVAANESGCLWLDNQGRVGLVTAAGIEKAIRGSAATALAMDDHRIVVATDEKLEIYTTGGEFQRNLPCDVGLGALALSGDRLAMGYGEGNVEILNLSTSKRSRDPLEKTPSSPVVSLLFGPSNTLAAGYASGEVSLWSLSNGALLNQEELHGPITHLRLQNNWILAASVLGAHLSWNLNALNSDYCQLVAEVWQSVPVVWRNGEAELKNPPLHHACAQ